MMKVLMQNINVGNKNQHYQHPEYFIEIFTTGEFEGLQKLTDASLHTEDGHVFNVHRMFLAFRNTFFRSMFCRNKLEKQFYVSNIAGKTLDTILVFLYIGYVKMSEENATSLLMGSSILKVQDLFQLCHSFALKNMTTKNCLYLFNAAWKIKEAHLLETCYRFVQLHFEEVLVNSKASVADLPIEALLRFLGDRSLNVTSEKTIWKAIVMWTESDFHNRSCLIPQLISVLSVEEIDEDLESEIFNNPIIKNNPFCNDALLKESPMSNPSSRLRHFCRNQNFDSNASNHRIPLNLKFVTYYSLSKDSPSIKLYLTYDDKLDIWRQVGEIDFWPDSLIQIKERIYMFSSLENGGLAFDVLSDSFVQIRQSPFPRFHFRVVALGGFIYTVGGATEREESTSLLECYDPILNTWKIMKSMIPMVLWEAITMGGFIYAIGEDVSATNPTMMVQVYDSATSIWSTVTAPKHYRQEFAVATFKDKLFVMGGHSPFSCLKSVEIYEPASDTWRDLPALPFTYVLPKAVVLDGKVLVYEDIFKGKRYGTVYPTVYFDEERRDWTTVEPGSPLTDIHLYQFCSLENYDVLKDVVANNRRPGIKWISSFLHNSSKSFN